MQPYPYRALVVDDEGTIRQLTMRALIRRGFDCDPAQDGVEAGELLAERRYDVVVTDLRMPRRHGHALAVDLLAMKDRPGVVVLTGVAEPKLANDLIVRGVDDVLFKPVDYDYLALKLRLLAQRRREAMGPGQVEAASGRPAGPTADEAGGRDPNAASIATDLDIEGKLAHLSKILPVSRAAFDVFAMANSNGYDSQQIAAAIARDPSLSVDVLRLANSSYYNASGQKVVELDDAVVRIGQKHIGELALATSALAALTANVLPWMDVGLAWRRSVAAGVAVDLLLAGRGPSPDDAGIFLSTIMHPLGRIALGMLFPQQYREMVEACHNHHTTLLEQERRLFPISHGQVMSRLLEAWNIPGAAHESLQHVADDYSSLATLSEPLRTKAELVKLAVLIGQIAVGQWEPWDCLELPPASVLSRLPAASLREIIDTTRQDSEDIVNFRMGASGAKSKGNLDRKRDADCGHIAYCRLSAGPFDFLAEIVASMGFRLRRIDDEHLEAEQRVLINCVSGPAYRLAPHGDLQRVGSDWLIVVDGDDHQPLTRYGKVAALPISFEVLRRACDRLAKLPEHAAMR